MIVIHITTFDGGERGKCEHNQYMPGGESIVRRTFKLTSGDVCSRMQETTEESPHHNLATAVSRCSKVRASIQTHQTIHVYVESCLSAQI